MAPINPLRRNVARPSPNQDDRTTSADKAESQKSSGAAPAQQTRASEQTLRTTSADKVTSAQETSPSEQALRARFTQDTFTPDVSASTKANTARLLGGNLLGQVGGAIGGAVGAVGGAVGGVVGGAVDAVGGAVGGAVGAVGGAVGGVVGAIGGLVGGAAPAEGEGNRPAPSYPSPAQLPTQAYGQEGTSPNETGQIGGAAELAQYAYAGYNGGEFGPVSIAPATLKQGEPGSPDYTESDAYVVSISGTEPVPEQSTGWITNFKVGSELNSPGLRNAKEAILRTVPEGSDLVLTGHSQGGMIAQQLAADPDLKEKYNIVSTVTFGSPLVAAGTREGEVHRIAASLDPVPRLSLESVVAAPWGLFGQQNISTASWNPITSHSINYTDESNPELARMDALGRVNPERPTSIEVDVSQRVFYSSPTNTIAGTPAGAEIPPPPVAPDANPPLDLLPDWRPFPGGFPFPIMNEDSPLFSDATWHPGPDYTDALFSYN